MGSIVMRKKILSLLILVLCLFPGNPRLITEAAGEGRTITINLASFPISVDPINVISDAEKHMLFNTHEPMVAWENGILVPAAAQKWVVSNGGKTYTFYLRKNSWSNGDPVTANDFVRSWKRAISYEDRVAAEAVTDIIYNAKAYRLGQIKSSDEIGIRALDRETVRVDLVEPSSYFLSLLTLPKFYPVHSRYITGAPAEKQAYAPGYCSNGCFRIKEWDQKTYALLSTNTHYTRKKPSAAEIKFTFFPPETGLALYAAGMVDLLESPPHNAFPDYEKEFIRVSTMSTGYIYLNLRRAPLNKYEVRKSLSLAINRDLLIEKVPGLSAIPATGLIPPGIPDGRSGVDFRAAGGELLDPVHGKRALDLLYSAGYPSEDGLPELDLLVVAGGISEKVGEIVAEMWRMNLGFTVNVKKVKWDEYKELCSTGRFYTARAGWEGDYPDPMTFLQLFHSQAPENFSSYTDEEYDLGLALAKDTTDIRNKYRIYHALEEKIVRDMAVIPLYFTTRDFLVSPALQNLRYTPEGYPVLQFVSKKK